MRVYRNEIYARHGRQFKSKDLQRQFGRTSWYKVDPTYSDARLSAEDKSCLGLIQKLEKGGGFYPLNTGAVLKPDLDGDGSTLTINTESSRGEGPKGVLQLFDLDISDGHRELMVVTDPGVEDEFEFQVFGYRDGSIVSLMDAPQWVSNSDFSVLTDAIRHSSDNCGTASTVTWTLRGGRFAKTEKTKKSNSHCAACPFVYTITEQGQRFAGEILRHQNSAELHRDDVIELGVFEAGTQLHVRLLELKPETTHLDSISIVIGEKEVLPTACERLPYRYCQTDQQLTTIEQGEALEFTFTVPISGRVKLKANGYYQPHADGVVAHR